MQEYTRFESFEGFRYSSAVMVNWKAGYPDLRPAAAGRLCEREHRLRHLGRDGAHRHRPALPQITPVRGFSAQPARPLRASTGRPFGMLNHNEAARRLSPQRLAARHIPAGAEQRPAGTPATPAIRRYVIMKVADIKRAACVGGGVIGSSWAIQFAMRGAGRDPVRHQRRTAQKERGPDAQEPGRSGAI